MKHANIAALDRNIVIDMMHYTSLFRKTFPYTKLPEEQFYVAKRGIRPPSYLLQCLAKNGDIV